MIAIKKDLLAPIYMRNLKQWCFYRLIRTKDDKGEVTRTKVPFDPNRPSGNASSTDSNTWSTLDLACEQFAKQHADGVCFMLHKDDGLVILDFDKCIAPDGSVSAEINYWINEFDSYTEVSQSGKGFHIVIQASMVGKGLKCGIHHVEAYHKERQICMQSNIYKDYKQINERQTVLDEFLARFFPEYDKDQSDDVPAEQLNIVSVEGDAVDKAQVAFVARYANKQLWNQTEVTRCDDDSQSGVDWAIALSALRMGFSDDMTAALVERNRQLFGREAKLRKHKKYLAITVANARKYIKENDAIDKEVTNMSENVIEFRGRRGREVEVAQSKPSGKDSGKPSDKAKPIMDALGPDFCLYSVAQTINCARDVTWLAKGYVPMDALVWLFGQPSKGKSFGVLSLAMAVAHTGSWGSIECDTGGVAYVCGEGLSGIGKRLQGLKHELLIKDDVPNLVVTNMPVMFTEYKQVAAFIDRLKARFTTEPLKLLIIDTKNTCMLGNENDNEIMSAFIRHLRTIQHEFKCAILVVDHVGHDANKRTRGSTVQLGAADAAYLFEGDDSFVPRANVPFRALLKTNKAPKDFDEPPTLELEARKVTFAATTDSKSCNLNTLVMQPTAPRIVIAPRIRIEELSNQQAVCLNILNRIYSDERKRVGTGGHIKLSHKYWRKACREAGVSKSAAHREAAFLIDNRFALAIPPEGDRTIDESLWYVSPIDVNNVGAVSAVNGVSDE